MGKIESPEYRREFLGIDHLNIVESEGADGTQLIVVGLEVAGKNLDLKDLPAFIFNANIFENIIAQISGSPLIGGKHGVGRIRPIIFAAYHVGILDLNIGYIALDAGSHFKSGGVVQFPDHALANH